MDPNACFKAWQDEMRIGELGSARAAAVDLLGWIRSGGFLPEWTIGEHEAFKRFCHTAGLRIPGRAA